MSYQTSHQLCLCVTLIIILLVKSSVRCHEMTTTLNTTIDNYDDYSDTTDATDKALPFVDIITDEFVSFVQQNHTNEDNVLLNWHTMATDLSDKLWHKLIPLLAKSQNRLENISQQCAGSLFKTVLGVKKQETWAVMFVDAMGKLPSGFLEGTVTSFGSVDECQDILVPDDGYDEGFQGKYCLLYLKPEVPPKSGIIKHSDSLFNLTGTAAEGTLFEHLSEVFSGIYSVNAIRIGLCIPSNCQNDEIKPLLSQIFKPYKIDADLSEKCLLKQNSYELSIHQKISLALILLMTILVLLATITHCILNKFNGVLTKSLHCWSVLRNYDQLMAPTGKASQRMAAVHGIRVLTIIWTTINHTYTFGGFYKIQWSYKSLTRVRKVPESFMFQLVFNAWALVETFFFLSGLLSIYITLPMLEKSKGKLNILLFIFHRLIRIIPSLCGIIAVNFLWPLLTNGPILIDNTTDVYVTQSCQNNWWHNLLLINNWFGPDDICLINTWYLSADFQLFLFAIVIIYTFYWNKTYGLILNALVMLISIIASALTTHNYNLFPTLLSDHTINLEYVEYHLKYGYFPTFQHFGPYCCGIFCGYFILNTPNNFKLPQTKSIISWIVCPTMSLSVLLLTYKWNNGVEPSRVSSILYSSLSRTIWCTGLAWITYVCCTGSGGIVNKLLSHPMFVPLSRLSFGVYLSHLVIIFIIFFTKKSVTDWTHFDFLTNGMVTIILSYVLALMLYFLLEAPFANLEKVVFKPNTNSQNNIKNISKEWHKTNEINGNYDINHIGNENNNNNNITLAKLSHVITKM